MRVYPWQFYRRRHARWVQLGFGIATCSVMVWFLSQTGWNIGLSAILILTGVGIILLFTILFEFLPLSAQRARKLLLRYLQEAPGQCPWCGYDMHACTDSRCSECGRESMLPRA